MLNGLCMILNNFNLIGLHCSIQGGYSRAVEEAKQLGATTFQIFTQNQRQWKQRQISKEEANAFVSACRDAGYDMVISHASYLINLASPDIKIRKLSIEAMKAELERCCMLGIRWVVVHPGSHRGVGLKAGWNNVKASLKELLTFTTKRGINVGILLENTAGQGSALGANIDELIEILRDFPEDFLGICLDTCHLWAAGYDLTGSGIKKVIDYLKQQHVLHRLHVWHLNNSKNTLGSKKDRHEHLPAGHIPLEVFEFIVKEFPQLPKIIETPKENDWDRRNLNYLFSFAR